MVYGAFSEEIMREAYKKLLTSPMGQRDLADSAVEICEELDRFLVERLWPEKKKRQRKRQEREAHRPDIKPVDRAEHNNPLSNNDPAIGGGM